MRISTPNSRPTGIEQLRIRSLRLFYMHGYIDGANRKYTTMRVISGKYRSRPLRSLRGLDIRPTSDRLRETLFNVLTAGNPRALEGSIWIDLFAGTGAVGIEALSRGAAKVYFLEQSPAAAKVIQGNLKSLGIASGVELIQNDVAKVLGRLEGEANTFDFIF